MDTVQFVCLCGILGWASQKIVSAIRSSADRIIAAIKAGKDGAQ
jgi:hypothetical protein